MNYAYDTMRRITQVSTAVSGNTHKTEYTYNAKDLLTSVKHNTTGDASDVTYNFVYDALGRQTQAKVGSQALCTTTYLGSGVHRGMVSKLTYGNGDTVNYTYDDFNRLKEVKWNTETTPRFTYTDLIEDEWHLILSSIFDDIVYFETKIDLASATGRVESAVFDEVHSSVIVTYLSNEDYSEEQIIIYLE